MVTANGLARLTLSHCKHVNIFICIHTYLCNTLKYINLKCRRLSCTYTAHTLMKVTLLLSYNFINKSAYTAFFKVLLLF